MNDSSSFSSLLALVDSHLSKTSIQESPSEDGKGVCNRILSSLNGVQASNVSDTLLYSPGQRLPLPSFPVRESSIQNVLAQQVANMLKAKEVKKKQDEEQQRLAEEMRKLKMEEDECVIDLMQALQTPCELALPYKEVLSSSSSLESLLEPKFIDCDVVSEKSETPEPILPCTTDMSYILHQKIKRGKGSAFGKVLCSRLRPVAAPYFREKIESTVVPFDFNTPSPCDIIKEKLRKPTCYTHSRFIPDILTMF